MLSERDLFLDIANLLEEAGGEFTLPGSMALNYYARRLRISQKFHGFADGFHPLDRNQHRHKGRELMLRGFDRIRDCRKGEPTPFSKNAFSSNLTPGDG